MKLVRVASRVFWMGTTSLIVLSADVSTPAIAQQPSPLPPVTVDAPRPQVRRSAPARRSTAARGPVRRVAQPLRQQEPIRYVTPSTGTIGAPPAAYAGGQVGSGTRVGILGNRSVFDTPYNITGYTDQLIRDQQARTLSDVVANDPSVRSGQTRYYVEDTFSIRGFFLSSNELTFDGLYGLTDQRRVAIAGIERAEVLRGPSALLNGVPQSGSVGGMINLVPKRATDEPITRATVRSASKASVGTSIDVGRRFGEDKAFGVRVNAAIDGGSTPVGGQYNRFSSISTGLDYRGDRFRLSADLGYQEQVYDRPTRSINVLPGFQVPRAPNLTTTINQPWENIRGDHRFGLLRGEYDIASNTTFFAAYGRSQANERFFSSTNTLLNAAGGVRQQPFLSINDINLQTAETGVRTRFTTGPFQHAVTVAASGFWETRDNIFTNVGTPNVTNLYNPIVFPERSIAGVPTNPRPSSSQDLRGLVLADTVSMLNDRIQITGGARYQSVSSESFNTLTGVRTAAYDADAVSPGAAVVVKPLQWLSVYGNYIEGLARGPIAPPTADNPNQVFPPFVSKQVEVGVKADFKTFGLTLATFQITQPSSVTNPATNIFSVNGERRNRGVEVGVFGEPIQGLRLLGGIAFYEAILTRTAGGLFDGRNAPGVSPVQFNLYADYDLPFAPAFGVNGRVIATAGPVFVDEANLQSIPAWTRFDLGARYRFLVDGRFWTARFNVENVAGKNYWQSIQFTPLSYGTARTYLFSISADL